MDIKCLTIGYSGTLGTFDGIPLKKKRNKLRDIFWTFNNDTVDASTRSGFYLINAVKILKDNYGVQPDQLKVSFWGSINKGNIDQIEKKGLNDYFTVEGYLPKFESLERLNDIDILFLPTEMSTSPDFESLFIPGKLYEYIEKGKPILSPSEESDCQRILIKSGLGIITEPNNASEIAKILFKYVQNRSMLFEKKPNIDYIRTFNFKNITKQMSETFDELLDI